MSLLTSLGTGAFLIALPGSLTLATLTIAAALPFRARAPTPAGQRSAVNDRTPPDPSDRTSALAPSKTARLVVLIPAHNESQGLRRTLESLKPEVAADSAARIVVIADNCQDDTADVARAAAVEVIERHDESRRGKGFALRLGFASVGEADWFLVVDADTDVDPGFLQAMRAAIERGSSALEAHEADALQCRYRVRDPLASARNTLADIAFGAFNVLRPRARATLGLSAGILGNGFALSRRTLQRVPFLANSIVEDVEYHHALVQAGLRVEWVDGAQVRGEVPLDAAAVGAQQARWEGGRLRLLANNGPELFQQAIIGRSGQLDLLADLLLLPLSLHTSLLLLAWALGGPWIHWLAEINLWMLVLHVVLAMQLIDASAAHWRALLGAPRYLLVKLARLPASWQAAARNAPWTRSKRSSS